MYDESSTRPVFRHSARALGPCTYRYWNVGAYGNGLPQRILTA